MTNIIPLPGVKPQLSSQKPVTLLTQLQTEEQKLIHRS